MAGVLLISVVLLIITWGISWQRLEAERTLLIAESTRQQENLAHIMAENLAQVLDRGKLLAVASNRLLRERGGQAGEMLAAMRSTDPSILRITLYSADAKPLYASSKMPTSPDIAQSIERMAKNSLSRWVPEVQIIARGHSNHAWDIQLLYPLIDLDGTFRGALLTVLDTGYFLGLYQRIDIGASGVIRILGPEDETLAEAHRAGIALLDEASRRSPLPKAGQPDGVISGRVTDEGEAQLVSYRKLSNYPLAISVSRKLAEIQQEYLASRSRVIHWLGWFSVVLGAAALWILGNFRRQRGLFRSMQHLNSAHQSLIEQLEEEKNQAFRLAAHDHLTGLNNRRMFQELVVSHLSRAKRSQRQYVLMFLDLDRFKRINDTLGHHVGDLLLQAVAARLRDCLRESDVVARLGGDEFAILLTGVDSLGDAQHIAEKLILQISQPCLDLAGHDVSVTPSIGLAVFPRDGSSFEALCRSADSAMYQAKRNGRGQHVFFDPTLNRLEDRLDDFERQLAHAIRDEQLVLHYQPRIRLSDHRIVGLEALIRWQHPEHGLIYPLDFIPLAEKSGLLGALGEWVVTQCGRQLVDWRAAGLPLVPVAINVSTSQLRDERLPGHIAAMLSAGELSGILLDVEITEATLVESAGWGSDVLASLNELGIGLALSDFGNRSASIDLVRATPIRCIKIDRRFINEIHKEGGNSAMADAIVALAHKLKISVAAEGVESRGQLLHLKTIGCDEAQGYYISRPLPAEGAGKLLSSLSLLDLP